MWAWHVKMATQNLLKFTRQRIVYSFLKLWKELESVVCFFLVVHLDMRFEVGGRVAWKVALCALVRFLPSVNEGVSLQNTILTIRLVTLSTVVRFLHRVWAGVGLQTTITAEQLVALCAIVLDPTVHLLVTEKQISSGTSCKINVLVSPLCEWGSGSSNYYSD